MTDRQTKIFNFYQLKGGVGKTTLTCMVASELIWQDIFERQNNSIDPIKIKDPLRIMVLDIDTQNSISVIREEEIKILRASADGNLETLQAMEERKPWQKNLCSRYQYLCSSFGWLSFDEIVVTMSDSSIQQAIKLIQSNYYDYVFMDFPGSYDQNYTGQLFLYTQYLLIPCDLNSQFDVAAGQKFLDDLKQISSYFHDLKYVGFIANKYKGDSVRSRRNQDLIESETGINFLTTKVKYCEYFKTEYLTTIYPKSIDLNLNTKKIKPNPNMSSIVDLANEIKTL